MIPYSFESYRGGKDGWTRWSQTKRSPLGFKAVTPNTEDTCLRNLSLRNQIWCTPTSGSVSILAYRVIWHRGSVGKRQGGDLRDQSERTAHICVMKILVQGQCIGWAHFLSFLVSPLLDSVSQQHIWCRDGAEGGNFRSKVRELGNEIWSPHPFWKSKQRKQLENLVPGTVAQGMSQGIGPQWGCTIVLTGLWVSCWSLLVGSANPVIGSAFHWTWPGRLSTAPLLEIRLLPAAMESNSTRFPLTVTLSLPLARGNLLLYKTTFSSLCPTRSYFTPIHSLKGSSLA